MASEIKTVSFVEGVLSSPSIYTLNGTFGEAISFLTGWYSVLARFPKETHPFAAQESEIWQKFKESLYEQENCFNIDVWRVIQEKYSNDEQRLDAVLNKYRTFMHKQRSRKFVE